ncbi:MAG: NIPSNAP family protein [Rhizobium sp.]|nr:MAG: NIPSNAP family protein [Rhizobium sp.]
MSADPMICEVRYFIDQNAMDEFKAYARTWMTLIERYGGTHHGYFISCKGPAGSPVSFPGTGKDDALDIAIARFTFPDDAAYARYRQEAARDPDGMAANSRYRNDPPFRSYERIFLERLL